MNNNKRVQFLLKSFFHQAKDKFYHFSQNCDVLQGLTDYHKGRLLITPYVDGQSIEYPYFAITRFETEQFSFDISYGDYDLSLEFHITFKGGQRYSLQDIASYFDHPIAKQDIYQGHTEGAIISILNKIARFMTLYFDQINNPSECFLIALQTIQQKRLQEKWTAQYDDRKKNAYTKAVQAIQIQDYKRALILMRPYKRDLAPEEQRMFFLALEGLGQ